MLPLAEIMLPSARLIRLEPPIPGRLPDKPNVVSGTPLSAYRNSSLESAMRILPDLSKARESLPTLTKPCSPKRLSITPFSPSLIVP